MQISNFDQVVDKIKNGGVGIIPTDTMYGIVASTTDITAIEKVYELRHRDTKKRCIVLISSLNELDLFKVVLNENSKKILNQLWPGPFSIDLPVSDADFPHLTRGSGGLAFRFPNNQNLIDFIKQTGPIIAPSANTEGDRPAENLDEAKAYFPNLDFYVDGGVLENNPSTVVSIVDGKIKVWRQGQGIVPPEFLPPPPNISS